MNEIAGTTILLGVGLGAIIGLLTGPVAVIFLLSMLKSSGKTVKNLLTLTTELLSLPTFMFGGPWVTGRIVSELKWDQILPFYILSLLIVFGIICCVPITRFVIGCSRKLADLESKE